eukprot:COSAG02_NODE_13550_length_1379_cov_1.225605_1_plen_111_part_00
MGGYGPTPRGQKGPSGRSQDSGASYDHDGRVEDWMSHVYRHMVNCPTLQYESGSATQVRVEIIDLAISGEISRARSAAGTECQLLHVLVFEYLNTKETRRSPDACACGAL